MTKRLMRVLLSTLALAILLIVGLGFVYMVTVEEDALGVATFHHKTWIPLLVLALGAVTRQDVLDLPKGEKIARMLHLH